MDIDYSKISPIAIWEITLGCNLKCLHCGSAAGIKRENELTTKEAINLCDEFTSINVDEVCLMGGEPLLRKDWYEIAKKLKSLNIKIDVITNGFHKNREELIQKLKSIDPFVVAVSLDGSCPKIHDVIRHKDSFRLATEFLFNLKSENIDATIITTVNKINYNDLPNIKDLILDKEIAWQIQTASPLGRFSKKYALNEEEFYALGLWVDSLKKNYSKKELPLIGAHGLGFNSRYMDSLALYDKWIGCPAGICAFGIQSDGGIKGCLSTPDYLLEENIRKKSLKEIWLGENSFKYNRKFVKENLGSNCINCKHGETCRGGCISKSTSLTGILHNDPWCYHRIEEKLLKEEIDPRTLLNKYFK